MKKVKIKNNIYWNKKKYEEFKKRTGNITLHILENMLDTIEDLAKLSISRKEAYRAFNQNIDYEWRDSAIGKWLQNLKQRKLIEIKKVKNEELIILTDKAKLKLVERIVARKKSDKCYRFITFDVPEKIAGKRDKFRLIIKRMGFVQVQKSLWVIDVDVTDLIETAISECKIEKYVAYIISSKSDIDGLIEKKLHAKRK